MNMAIAPTKNAFEAARDHIQLMDTNNFKPVTSTSIISKTTKNLKTVKAPVMRYFEEPGQISSYYTEGEFDLVSIFKLLKYESYFFKSVQKKNALLVKSGLGISVENDDVKEYMNKRFLMMQLQTGYSLDFIIKQLAYYLIVCSNAFLVKARDKDCQFARPYTIDNKERQPIVGLFIAHPTSMKPKWKYAREGGMWKLVLDKWVQTNKRGQIKEFNVDDVVHFTLFKEDGMLFGTPEVVPVIDDIRTLRKIEEDVQLLIYRDLFPIIHYAVESPRMLDHATRKTELDQASADMNRIVQDGGIATDARHEIKFVGGEGKHLDARPYLEYFQQRVFSGLGVSALDMSISQKTNAESAQSVSNQLIDSVKFIQYELSNQFNEQVLLEIALQSPFDDILLSENMPKLIFEEIDMEWKIRKENHQADLFAKNVDTFHETRNKLGRKSATDEDIMYTYGSMYGAQPAHVTMLDTGYGDKYASHEGKVAHATAVETVTNTSQSGTPSKKMHTKPIVPAKSKPSAATADPIKSSKTNSNIVKKKARDYIHDSIDTGIKEEFISIMNKIRDEHKGSRKMQIVMATKFMYDRIKENMQDSMLEGMQAACEDLDIEYYDERVAHNIFAPLDKLRDSVSDMVYKDPDSVNRAANRIMIADRTEQSRAWNYGYALVCQNNGYNKFVICSDFDNISKDSSELIGKEISITRENIADKIPPFRPNSRLKIKVIQEQLR